MGMKIIQLVIAVCLIQLHIYAQPASQNIDTALNNLVLPPGYVSCEYGDIPAYSKKGSGKKTLLLIPGMGFDASVFDDFVKANKNYYTMFVITIPGYGNTKAAPMPPAGTSYGEQSWNMGVVKGLVKLINKEKLDRPVIVGHFVQGVQIAVQLAIDHPEITGGLILVGGPAKFIAAMNGKIYDHPLDKMIQFTDKYTAPVWFKNMKKEFYDANNFSSMIYSLDSVTGTSLREKSATVAMPIAVRYSCEYFASDVRAGFDKIKCPVLVLRPMFNEKVLESPENSYLRPQFIDSWNDATKRNPLISIKDIAGAATCTWKDKPSETYQAIHEFLAGLRQ